ncbi:hypothetical protein O5166_26345, partial [Escherichia coli]|nr:hypothetical protein [Escherichia coli]
NLYLFRSQCGFEFIRENIAGLNKPAPASISAGLIIYTGVNPLIITLGTLYLFGGIKKSDALRFLLPTAKRGEPSFALLI